jgi:uncharacterized protein (TIGR03118 family)
MPAVVGGTRRARSRSSAGRPISWKNQDYLVSVPFLEILMTNWFRRLGKFIRGDQLARKSVRYRPVVVSLEDRWLLASGFLQTNLVSDIPGLAAVLDANLINPWGLTASATSPFWVSDNNAGVSTLYNGQGAIVPLVVTIPTNTITEPPTLGSPSGTVANTFGTGFDVTPGGPSAAFLFDTEDGNIDAWAGGNIATVEVNNPDAGFKGLTLGTDSAGDNLLYAANFVQGTIDVYDQNFQQVQGSPGGNTGQSPITLAGTFTDPNIPAGYAPFNIQNINGNLYVEYAKFDPTTTEGLPGAGGFVDVYNPDGVLLTAQQPLISNGALNAPWGVALAPSNFGKFSNDLLVGNFGDGFINAFDPTTGQLRGQLTLANGQPFQEDDLWALRFGNGGAAGATSTLFFTAGIDDQMHGLFGSLQALPHLGRNADLLTNLANAPQQTVPTVPANGDQNPYGVAFVPQDFPSGGTLQPDDILVSNFNNSDNVQGTGSTIVRITPDGQQSVFFQGAPGLGLTTALGVLKSGFVIVGSVPATADGTVQQGSLLILDSSGNVVSQLSDSALLNGPWDLAVNDLGDRAQVFVSNVLSGSVTRLDLRIPNGGTPIVESETQIASGYAHRPDENALVVGPTGLAFDPVRDILYVASTADNEIFGIPNAAVSQRDHGKGFVAVRDRAHLHGPLGLVLAPNGDLIVANGDAVNQDPNQLNELVEFTPTGRFVGQFQIDNGPAGGAFGLAVSSAGGRLRFAAVDDNTNTLQIWTFRQKSATDDRSSFSPAPHAAADEVFRLLAESFAEARHHGSDFLFDLL